MNNATPIPDNFYFYYEATEKIESRWISKNSISHEFSNGKGKIRLKDSEKSIINNLFLPYFNDNNC